MRPDPLRAVANELTALAGSDRRAILRALDRADRARIVDAMRGGPMSAHTLPAGGHSPWLASMIDAALAGREIPTPTKAARAAFCGVVASDARPARSSLPGRTLMQAAGELLGSRSR